MFGMSLQSAANKFKRRVRPVKSKDAYENKVNETVDESVITVEDVKDEKIILTVEIVALESNRKVSFCLNFDLR